MTTKNSLPIEQYQVGIICALRHEMTAAIATLDERHQPITGQDKLDANSYVLGRVHEHNVVVACLPAGVYGTNAAARVANDMLRTFSGLRFGLMVGIGGGIPNLAKRLDIRLGDVVISQPDKTFGGVVQYDLRKNLVEGQFERKGSLKPPPTILLAALATLQAEHDLDDSRVPIILADMITKHPNLVKNRYDFPGRENDTLYCPRCDGSGSSSSCNLCTDGKIKRSAREDHHPSFWYGVIASGNELMKNAAERDKIGQEFGALCVEMEAAGLMNDFPCIVIRGICDYADSHKNDGWQKYAALAAAAYAKELLAYISPKQASLEKPIQDIVASLDKHLAKQSSAVEEHLHEAKREHEKQDQRYQNAQHRQCHRAFKTSTYEQFKNVNLDRVEGTCQWVLSHPRYLQWYTKPCDDLLWISADPGCGKSVLAKSLVDNELRTTGQHTVCYFFFKDNEEQDGLATALCALLHQLFSHQPRLIQCAIPAWEKTGEKLVKEVPELWRTLVAAARDDQVHDVTFVLDALDECRLSDRRWLIDMLAKFYTRISPSTSATRQGRLKFLVTSRPYDDIQAEFQKTLDNLPTIRLRGEEENDQIHQEIDLVIRTRVTQLAEDLKLHRQIKEQLEAKLLEMEHRTYLWLYLAIGGIYETYRNSLRPKEVAIKSLPSTVEEAYEKILSRISKEQRSNVKKILQIVVGARRPLAVQEMAIALGLATSIHPKSLHEARIDPVRLETNIRHWCGLFVFINHKRIYLIHQTAKEFLIYNSNSTLLSTGWKYCLNPQEIEKDMAWICMVFLSLKDSWPTAQSLVWKCKRHERIDDVLKKDDYIESFIVYAAEYWPSHVRDADMLTDNSTKAELFQLYAIDGPLYNLWFPIFWKTAYPYEKQPLMKSIRLTALLGHEKLLQLMLQSTECNEINESDDNGRTALVWASRLGYDKVVQMLMDAGADVNAQGGGFYGNALQAASQRGYEKVIQMLMDAGADVNAQGGGYYHNALQAASGGGHEKVVQMLMDAGADVNAQGGGFYGNALQAASQRGYEKVVQILMDAGADVNAQGGHYGNALQAASGGGHEKVVQMLMDAGVDVNAQGGHYGNALQAASDGGHEKVVQMLMDAGADVNAQGGHYGNALQAASESGHEKVVQMLIDAGADVMFKEESMAMSEQAGKEAGNA